MFDPREFLAVARQSQVQLRGEAACRTAIGRAYYAAFLVAREYVGGNRLSVQPPAGQRWGSHERIIFALGSVRASGARGIQKRLFRLKKLRTLADYDPGYTEAERDVARAVQDAERVIAWIDGLPR